MQSRRRNVVAIVAEQPMRIYDASGGDDELFSLFRYVSSSYWLYSRPSPTAGDVQRRLLAITNDRPSVNGDAAIGIVTAMRLLAADSSVR